MQPHTPMVAGADVVTDEENIFIDDALPGDGEGSEDMSNAGVKRLLQEVSNSVAVLRTKADQVEEENETLANAIATMRTRHEMAMDELRGALNAHRECMKSLSLRSELTQTVLETYRKDFVGFAVRKQMDYARFCVADAFALLFPESMVSDSKKARIIRPETFMNDFDGRHESVYWDTFRGNLLELFLNYTVEYYSGGRCLKQSKSVFSDFNHTKLLPDEDPYYRYYNPRKPYATITGKDVSMNAVLSKFEKNQWSGSYEALFDDEMKFFLPRIIMAYNTVKAIIAEGELALEGVYRAIRVLETATPGAGAQANLFPAIEIDTKFATGTGLTRRGAADVCAVLARDREDEEKEKDNGRVERDQNERPLQPEHPTFGFVPESIREAHIPNEYSPQRPEIAYSSSDKHKRFFRQLLHPWRDHPDKVTDANAGDLYDLGEDSEGNSEYDVPAFDSTGKPLGDHEMSSDDPPDDVAESIANYRDQIARGLYLKEKRLARLNTIRKCLEVVLDDTLKELALRGGTYLRKITNKAAHAGNLRNAVTAEALKNVQMVIDEFGGGALRPKWDAQMEMDRLTRIFDDKKNCFEGGDTSLENAIDEHLGKAQTRDTVPLLAWLNRTFTDADPMPVG